jgi:hypothetical protein
MLVLSCKKTSPPNSTAPEELTTVEITFDGLMVFRQVADHYEVGVLDSHQVNHKLRITVGDKVLSDEQLAEFMKTKSWTLNVVTASGNQAPNIKPRQYKACNRLQDTKDPQLDIKHVFDLCWMLDMETELHDGKELPMNEGVLTPIIKLYNGELYTKYNYDALDAGKGKSPTYNPLGYVSDMVALKVNLNPGEKLVLNAGNQVIFTLTPEGEHCAGIFNQPNGGDKDKESHFRYYYNLLFTSVPEDERYQIRVSPTLTTHPPNWGYPGSAKDKADRDFNILSDIRIRCWDHEMCGAVFLGKSTGPLK